MAFRMGMEMIRVVRKLLRAIFRRSQVDRRRAIVQPGILKAGDGGRLFRAQGRDKDTANEDLLNERDG